MSAGDNASRRGTAAIIVATAAITLAIGVTAAALGGYLGPRDQAQTQPAAAAAPSVVLVPVTNQPPVEQPQVVPAADEAAPTFAEYRRHREHEHEREYEHHREDDDEHEDDD